MIGRKVSNYINNKLMDFIFEKSLIAPATKIAQMSSIDGFRWKYSVINLFIDRHTVKNYDTR